MGKKKRSKDEIVNLIRSFWTRKRAKRPYTVPMAYLEAVADQLWRQNPTKTIVLNTVKDIWTKAYADGYARKGEDGLFFKNKREQAIKADFDAFKDSLDDLIHDKNQQKTV
jgi:phage terminase small subunit